MKMKIKNFVKPVAVIGTAAMLISASGCSDTSWSFKTKNKTFTNGGWIYYTYAALNDAIDKIDEDSDSSFDITKDDITKKKIEKKDALDWIYDNAKEKAIEYLTVEKLCNDNKLKADKDEIKTMKDNYQSFFDSGYMGIYEQLGISADTFTDIYGTYNLRYEQLFDFIYGEGGSKEIPDDEISKYFTENYTSYYYIPYSFKTTDEDGNETDVDDETKDKVITDFAKYAKELNEGKTTDDIDTEYKEDFEVETSPSVKATTIMSDANVPEDLQKIIEDLGDKKATVKTIDDTHYLVYKGSISEEAKALIDGTSENTTVTADTIRHKMKDDEFEKYVDSEEKKLKYEMNDACISRYTVQRTIDIVKSYTASQSAS